MNPALETLLRAYDAVILADNEQAPEAWREFETLLEQMLAQNPNVDREQFKRAIHAAHRRWIHAQQKPTSLPPQA